MYMYFSEELSFVYFGSPDDSNLGKGDETTSGKVFFDKPVHFYGKVYASAKVCCMLYNIFL